MKTPVSGEALSVLLEGRHATPLVTRPCFLFTSITYETTDHAIGHEMIYHECYGFERAFFTLKRCFTLHLILVFRTASSLTSKLAGLLAPV